MGNMILIGWNVCLGFLKIDDIFREYNIIRNNISGEYTLYSDSAVSQVNSVGLDEQQCLEDIRIEQAIFYQLWD